MLFDEVINMAEQKGNKETPAGEQENQEVVDRVTLDFLRMNPPHVERFEIRKAKNGDFYMVGIYDVQDKIAGIFETSSKGAEFLVENLSKKLLDNK